MDDIIRAISDSVPKFNDELLIEFNKREIDFSTEFVDLAFRDAVKLNNGAITYDGYTILKPEERARFEMGVGSKSQKRHKIQLATSEMQLVEYHFTHEGKRVEPPVLIYTPYMHHNMLVVRNKQYAVHRGIAEQVFSRVRNAKVDGVMVRPIRVPVEFNRKHSFRLVSSVTGHIIATPFVVTTKLHSKLPPKRKCETTVVHYLICKYGFYNVMAKFGLSPDDLSFVQYPDRNDQDHEYFVARLKSRENNLHLRVRKEVLNNDMHRKLVANVLYTLVHFDLQTPAELVETGGAIWRVLMGKLIGPDSTIIKARTDADVHIASVDVVIDPLSRKRFNLFDVAIDDIYDLLVYIFINLDYIMVNSTPQNLYNKRIDVIHGIFIESYAKVIFYKFYGTNQRHVLRAKEVKRLLKFKPMIITNAFSSQRGGARNISTAPQMFNDNWLISVGIHKIRQSGSPEQRFHPSMAVVESLVAFTGDSVSRAGYINPNLEITPAGSIVWPEYASDIDAIMEYLPRT